MNTCCPCGIRGIVTEATWAMETWELKNWYMCDRHARLMGETANLFGRPMRQLEDATEVRQRQKGENQ